MRFANWGKWNENDENAETIRTDSRDLFFFECIYQRGMLCNVAFKIAFQIHKCFGNQKSVLVYYIYIRMRLFSSDRKIP